MHDATIAAAHITNQPAAGWSGPRGRDGPRPAPARHVRLATIVRAAGDGAVRHAPAGVVVVRQGETPQHVHVVEAGRLELVHHRGGRRVAIDVVGTGAAIADAAALTSTPAVTSAITVTPTRLVSAPVDAFRRLLLAHPRAALRWLEASSRQALALRRWQATGVAGAVQPRLAALLVREADPTGAVHIAQTTLADLLGVHRSTVNRALKALEELGAVALEYRCVQITDMQRLASVAATA